MATIVLHQPTNQRYILLGAGYGAFSHVRPDDLLGMLKPHESKGMDSLVAVCGIDGKLGWLRMEETVVLSVDGRDPNALLAAATQPYR